mmetsp:Transcript_71857/g.114423  ORF Transcript_71857/g.114423 Transcript_71857/m.114423 type:complete len:211 (+) Transcript_71857:819-1451(+)
MAHFVVLPKYFRTAFRWRHSRLWTGCWCRRSSGRWSGSHGWRCGQDDAHRLLRGIIVAHFLGFRARGGGIGARAHSNVGLDVAAIRRVERIVVDEFVGGGIGEIRTGVAAQRGIKIRDLVLCAAIAVHVGPLVDGESVTVVLEPRHIAFLHLRHLQAFGARCRTAALWVISCRGVAITQTGASVACSATAAAVGCARSRAGGSWIGSRSS